MSLNVVGLRALLVGTLAVTLPAAARGQEPELRISAAEENFRAAPSGTRIAVLLRDARLAGGESRDRWREATLEAWVRESGVVPTNRDGRDLAVRASGTTLHASPDGAVVARGLEGFLLDEVSRADGWVRVRRTGWIWAESLEPAPTAPVSGSRPVPAGSVVPTETAGSSARAASAAAGPRTIHASPGGPQLGSISGQTPLEVVGQEGEWARVRVEGWVRVPSGAEVDLTRPLRNLSLRALREAPDAYRGRAIAWRVQFVAVQRADSLRSDLAPGENYILARDPGGEPGYVYIAVPPELLAAAQRVVPLQQVEVVGRVRTGRSALMGHPVLDLLELRTDNPDQR